MNKKLGALTLCMTLMFSGCGAAKPNVEGVDPKAYVEGVNSFTWNLYGQLDAEENQFYSAYGITQALLMAANGAKGSTYEQLLSLYGLEDIDKLNREALALSNAVSEDGFINANALWIDQNLVKSEEYDLYEKTVTDHYDAEIKTVDFAGSIDTVKKDISNWVKNKTKGFIDDYNSQVTKNTASDLINAVYFKGEWEIPFEIDNTVDQPFYGLAMQQDVPMMHLYSANVPYYENGVLKAVTLRYEDCTKAVTFITTKDKSENIASVWNSYSNEQKNDVLMNLDTSYEEEVDVLAVPSLEMDITMNNLPQALIQLGASDMFTSKADFSKIADSLYISSIVHRAKVKMDEKGTEAAAITEIVFETAMAPVEEEKKEFIADHPYLFVIRDMETGVILFVGTVQDV